MQRVGCESQRDKLKRRIRWVLLSVPLNFNLVFLSYFRKCHQVSVNRFVCLLLTGLKVLICPRQTLILPSFPLLIPNPLHLENISFPWLLAHRSAFRFGINPRQSIHLLSNMHWSKPDVSGTLPPKICKHSSTFINSKLYVFGGTEDNEPTESDNLCELWVLDTGIGEKRRRERERERESQPNLLAFFLLPYFLYHLHFLHILHAEIFHWTRPVVTGEIPPHHHAHFASAYGNKLLGKYHWGYRRTNEYMIIHIIVLISIYVYASEDIYIYIIYISRNESRYRSIININSV